MYQFFFVSGVCVGYPKEYMTGVLNNSKKGIIAYLTSTKCNINVKGMYLGLICKWLDKKIDRQDIFGIDRQLDKKICKYIAKVKSI